jgi:hypothetical protein
MKHVCTLLALVFLIACTRGHDVDPESMLSKRPSGPGNVYDFVGVMKDVSESAGRYLNTIEDRYGIEILIVVLPRLPESKTIAETASEMHSNWNIGKDQGSRGILILLVDDVKEVKVEVGFGLEDVFTDLFTSLVETRQLQPHYDAGTLHVGLIALLEECEARAQIKHMDRYTPDDISRRDHRYLSQGGGARHELTEPARTAEWPKTLNPTYPAGQSPDDAWNTLLKAWNDAVSDPFLGVYTATARLAYRDYTTTPAEALKKNHRTYAKKAYRILTDGAYAVISFGNTKGWDNAPFLFCRTQEGWQFDLVSQRRFIRMGPAPDWGVEYGDHPYMTLLMDSFRYHGQDIPLPEQDRYTPDRDKIVADQILDAEARYREKPNDAETALRLGRLYAITAMGPKAIPLLTAAATSTPDDHRPYQYLAVAHVDAHYQYASALAALERVVDLRPDAYFGWAFTGYIHYRNKDDSKAVQAFDKALDIEPDDAYAHTYLALSYARLHQKALALDPRRATYEELSRRHAEKVRASATDHPIRVRQLERLMDR